MSLQPERPAGVIHDIGYRPYDGRRLGEASVAWSLFVLGTRHAYGLGRSARSKVLPFILLGIMLAIALVIVGAVTLVELPDNRLPLHPAEYQSWMLVVISVYVAAQAPTLFSRDIRYRALTLYFARPIRRTTFVLVRFASLTAAVFLLIAVPLLVLYVGALLADMPFGRETRALVAALVGALLLSLLLAAFSSVIAAITVRRGLAIAAIIVALVVSHTIVITIRGVTFETGNPDIARVASLFSPYALVRGFLVWAFDVPTGFPPITIGATAGLGYLFVALIIVLAGIGLLMLRYRKLAAV